MHCPISFLILMPSQTMSYKRKVIPDTWFKTFNDIFLKKIENSGVRIAQVHRDYSQGENCISHQHRYLATLSTKI